MDQYGNKAQNDELDPPLIFKDPQTVQGNILKHVFFRSVVDKNPGIIEGIVVAPTLGTMYWHDDDGEKETLKSSRMDGTRVDQVCAAYIR